MRRWPCTGCPTRISNRTTGRRHALSCWTCRRSYGDGRTPTSTCAEALHEVAVVENQLALAYLASGNVLRAGTLAGHARMRHELDGDQRSLAHVADTQAQIAIAQERYEDAVELAREARQLAKATGNPGTYSAAMLTIARAQAANGKTDEAIESYRTGVIELRERGPVVRLQQGLGEWAELLAKAGRHEEAYSLTREALHAASNQIAGSSGTMRKARGASEAEATAPAAPKAAVATRVRVKARAG
jgi:tetratricopeptide (TPR) repeat protein